MKKLGDIVHNKCKGYWWKKRELKKNYYKKTKRTFSSTHTHSHSININLKDTIIHMQDSRDTKIIKHIKELTVHGGWIQRLA